MSEIHTDKLDRLTAMTQGEFDAFLYDCDGTLADNMLAHKAAYVRVAADHGLQLHPGIIDELAGLPTVMVVEEINKRYQTQFDPKVFARLKSQAFIEHYIDDTQPVDFVVQHLKAHVGKKKIAVVTGGSRSTVSRTLQVLGIGHLIDLMVCAGETPHGKPFPDPFLKAAELLGVEPSRCMVFEDGDPGVQAAEAAGMQWIRVDKV